MMTVVVGGCVYTWPIPGHWLPVEAEDVAAPELSLQQRWQEGRASSSTTAAAQIILISPLKPPKLLPFEQNPISWAGPQPGEAQPRLTADMDKYRVNGTEMGGSWEGARRVSTLFVF